MCASALIRPPLLDHPKAKLSGFAQGDVLVASPDFVSMIVTLFSITSCSLPHCSIYAEPPTFRPHLQGKWTKHRGPRRGSGTC